MDNNKSLWEENILKYALAWPDENVVRFIKKIFTDEELSSIRVLDYGAGSGRNSVALASLGIDVYMADYNEKNLQLAQKILAKRGLKAKAFVNDGVNIPIEDNTFDAVIAWGSLFCCTDEQRAALMKEINRVLKKSPNGRSGVFFANWRSKEDYFYQKGEKVNDNMYILDKRAADYGLEGISYYFADQNDLRTLYESTGFKIFNIEKKEFIIDNMKVKNSHWHIWAEKI